MGEGEDEGILVGCVVVLPVGVVVLVSFPRTVPVVVGATVDRSPVVLPCPEEVEEGTELSGEGVAELSGIFVVNSPVVEEPEVEETGF